MAGARVAGTRREGGQGGGGMADKMAESPAATIVLSKFQHGIDFCWARSAPGRSNSHKFQPSTGQRVMVIHLAAAGRAIVHRPHRDAMEHLLSLRHPWAGGSPRPTRPRS